MKTTLDTEVVLNFISENIADVNELTEAHHLFIWDGYVPTGDTYDVADPDVPEEDEKFYYAYGLVWRSQ